MVACRIGAMIGFVIASCFVVGSPAYAELGTRDETCKMVGSRSWAPAPWHLVDMWTHVNGPDTFQSLSIDVEVDGDVTQPGGGKLTYIAPIYGKINDNGFYFGMQTDVSRPGGAVRGFLFSRWGRASTQDARVAAEGWSSALTAAQSGEGDFVGVRVAYPWSAGRYTFHLRPDRLDGDATWIGLTIHDHQTNDDIDVGSLRFPGRQVVLDGAVASFVEIYGGDVINNLCRSRMPATGVTVLSRLLVNGQAINLRRDSSCYFSKDVPPLTSITRTVSKIAIQFGRVPVGAPCD